jgi:hypothetical protein
MSTRRFPLAAAALAAALSIVGSHAAQAQQAQHFAVLSGGNEVGPTGQANAGDRNGYGTASVVVVGPSQICFSIVVDQIGPPVAAHIHRGPAGVNGPIVVPLTTPPSGDPGTSSGCVPGLAAGLVTAIRTNPSQFYVNVHTAAFPGGAVRGQLF